jgi:CheY-like chemotaxis protein
MARVLLVDDDADQTAIRKLIFEKAGHDVITAGTCDQARQAFAARDPEIVVMDLRLPGDCDGLELIREFREVKPDLRIVVLSGHPADVAGRPEAQMIDGVLSKPARSARLLSLISKLTLLCASLTFAAPAQKMTYTFHTDRPGEAVADITMSAPGADWGRAGHEAAVADIQVDSSRTFQQMLYAGDTPRRYPIFLGALGAGDHSVTIRQNRQYSAPGTSVSVVEAKFRGGIDDPVVANAPILSARENTIGKFTDAPMVLYAEKVRDNGADLLQYTMIFTNEDGGTSTRALMARWGRTTDIEYIYRVNPQTHRATIQARDHKEEEFQGEHEGLHPLLLPVTDNNMVAGGTSAIRYQIAPRLVDLSDSSREEVMNDDPVMYRVMSQELEREGKLRPFGEVDGEKISDPRNYLYIEAKVENRTSAVSAHIRLQNETFWRSSDLGRLDYGIERDDWVQTTIELPPGTKLDQVADIGFDCSVMPDDDKDHMALTGQCRVDRVSKVFQLDRAYRPSASTWSLPAPVDIPAGLMRVWSVPRVH